MILLANAIAAMGRSVTILALVADGPLRALVDDRVAVTRVPGHHLRSAAPGLRKALSTLRPDAIVSAEAASNLLTILVARSLPRRVRPRIILREVSSASVSQRHDPYRQTRMAYAVLRFAYRWADAVVTLTEGALLDLADNFGVPRRKLFHMMSNAVIDDEARPFPNDDRAHEPGLVVSVGRLSPEKDHATLLKAFAMVSRTIATRLDVFGSGPLRADLERLAHDLGLQDRVTFKGFVLDPFAVFHGASLLVSSSRFEGFGNVLVEAMSCGTPVVATDCPYGPSEILDGGRYGLLVPVGDAVALARAIEKALASEPDRSALRARAATHTVGRAADALNAIIDTVTRSGDRPSAASRFTM